MDNQPAAHDFDVLELPFLTEEECDSIKEFFYWKEQELISQGFEDYFDHKAYDNVLSSNYFRYNFFHYFPELADRLVDLLCVAVNPANLQWPIAVQAWCNIYRTGQGIDWHNHRGTMGSSWTANIFIDGPTTPGITYKPFNEKTKLYENKRGYIHIIPCELFHKVPPNQTEQDRLSIGMTIHSYPTITQTLIDRYAFNSKTYQDTVILTREHIVNGQT